MIDPIIQKYFQIHSDSRGIPDISNRDWISFTSTYEKELIRENLAEYITNNNIPFPTKEISYSEFVDLFERFSKTSMLDEYKHFDKVLEKVDYKYSYSDKPLGVIDKSHVYNSVSNYFQQTNRMKCGSNLVDSPWDIWHSREKLEKMNWHFWREGALGNSEIGRAHV